MFNLLSLLHPNPKSLNNNVDDLQFWNCSISEGLFVYLTGRWLRISHDVKNNKFGVMLASWVHGLQELAKSLWNLMVTPHNFRAKEKGCPGPPDAPPHTETKTAPLPQKKSKQGCWMISYMLLTLFVFVLVGPMTLTTISAILVVCGRQIVTNSAFLFWSLVEATAWQVK